MSGCGGRTPGRLSPGGGWKHVNADLVGTARFQAALQQDRELASHQHLVACIGRILWAHGINISSCRVGLA